MSISYKKSPGFTHPTLLNLDRKPGKSQPNAGKPHRTGSAKPCIFKYMPIPQFVRLLAPSVKSDRQAPQSTNCFGTLLKRLWNAIRGVCFLLVTSELVSVTQEVASSSLVVPPFFQTLSRRLTPIPSERAYSALFMGFTRLKVSLTSRRPLNGAKSRTN